VQVPAAATRAQVVVTYPGSVQGAKVEPLEVAVVVHPQ
jgi:hypothetical protein